MSDVTRYSVHKEFIEEITPHIDTRVLTLSHTEVVLAADYDRDTQALQAQLELTRDLVTAAKDAKDDVVNDANITIAILQRRVEELDAHIGAHHKMPCATCDVKQAAIAQLTARLAACREAINDMDYALVGGNRDGEPIAVRVVDGWIKAVNKALAQEGKG